MIATGFQTNGSMKSGVFEVVPRKHECLEPNFGGSTASSMVAAQVANSSFATRVKRAQEHPRPQWTLECAEHVHVGNMHEIRVICPLSRRSRQLEGPVRSLVSPNQQRKSLEEDLFDAPVFTAIGPCTRQPKPRVATRKSAKGSGTSIANAVGPSIRRHRVHREFPSPSRS
jgi:hypothetical protein